MIEKKVKSHKAKPKGRPHFIKEWRKFRNLNQDQLAERIGRSIATISQIENRKQEYTQTTLEAIALALGCEPADLIMRNPLDTAAPWSLWESAKAGEKEQILGMMKIIIGGKTGTNG